MMLLKLGCVLIYALGMAGWLHVLPEGEFSRSVQMLSVILLVAHVIELPFAFKHLRKYPGPLLVSVLLTVLFGLFHWRPLSRLNGDT